MDADADIDEEDGGICGGSDVTERDGAEDSSDSIEALDDEEALDERDIVFDVIEGAADEVDPEGLMHSDASA